MQEKIGEDHIYPTIEAAISAIHPLTHRGEKEEKNCPLKTVCRIVHNIDEHLQVFIIRPRERIHIDDIDKVCKVFILKV